MVDVDGKYLLAPVLAILLIIAYPSTLSYTVNRVDVEVFRDGSVKITYIVYADPPEEVSLTLPSEPVFLQVTGEFGSITYTLDGSRLSFITPYESVRIESYHIDLTSKEGAVWRLAIDIQYPYSIILPENVVFLNISRNDYQLVFRDGNPTLLVGGGEIIIEYVLAPEEPPEAVGGGGNASQPPGDEGVPPNKDGLSSTYLLLILLIVAGLASILGYRYLRRREEASKILEESDERDELILKALEEGPKTASELIEITGIPKSPLYRRLAKLEEQGLIERVKIGGRRVYRLRR